MAGTSARRFWMVFAAAAAATALMAGVAASPPDHGSGHAAPPASKPAPSQNGGHAPAAPPKSVPTTPAQTAPKTSPKATSPATHQSTPTEALVPVDQHTDKSEESSAAPSPDDVLTMLKLGNERWVDGKPINPHTQINRRADLAANGQNPQATILTCSDSRLPVERLFDCGVGDVFVIRVAGNVIDNHQAGTIEYGVEHLHTPLLVIMGHTKCGAVAAAATNADVHGHVKDLVECIEPAVARTHQLHPELEGDALIAEAVRENVWQGVFDLLKTSATLRGQIKAGDVKVVGAVCDIATGQVTWMGEHPWQKELVSAMDQAQTTEAHAAATEH